MNFYFKWDNINKYDIECLFRLFFDNTTLKNTNTDDYTLIDKQSNEVTIEIQIETKKFKNSFKFTDDQEKCHRQLAVCIYKILCEATGITPPWGILTGIRPVKLFRKYSEKMGPGPAKMYFHNKFLVEQKKVDLAETTMRTENEILKLSKDNSVSLYVAIPFCPTKCCYCSFVSSSVEKSMHLVQKYVDLLCVELKETSKIINDLNLKLETVYVGGGTPTTLSAAQLSQLINVINENFDMNDVREFTVEAGRPDTITADKLLVLKSGKVSRISINPQTLNDSVLKVIGRKHTSKETIDSFRLARSLDFNNINTDLIAGLPNDSIESFKKTLFQILNLGPENITIHTLSIKRASSFDTDYKNSLLSKNNDVAQMLNFAQSTLEQNQFNPYYLYRQSNMVGNFENVGWAKIGTECLYNVYIMDEVHTILSCGAGAVTKVRDPHSDRIERIFNFKYPYEYIDRFNEILSRKEKVKILYDEF